MMGDGHMRGGDQDFRMSAETTTATDQKAKLPSRHVALHSGTSNGIQRDAALKIRIMRICPAPGYLPDFRKKHRLVRKPYFEQVKILQAEGVFLPGGWAACMERLGFEVFDVLYGDIQLAARWAEENNALQSFNGTNPLFEVLTHQARSFQPDIILFWTGAFFRIDRKHRMELRQLLGKPVLIAGVWGDEVPYGETYENYFGDIDVMFSVNSAYQKRFEKAGIRAYTMGSGFDEAIERKPLSMEKSYSVIVCGDTGFNKIDHIRRYETLCKVAAETDIRIFANEPIRFRRELFVFGLNTLALLPRVILVPADRFLSASPVMREWKITKAIKFVRLIKRTGASAASFFPGSNHPRQNYFVRKKPLKKLFPRKVTKGPLDASQYYDLLSKSRIVLNVHRDEEEDFGNLRVFEVTGVGSLLLTDRGEKLKEFFRVDDGSEDALQTAEIATFTDAEDCVRKIDFLLNNPDVATRIAENGRRRTLRDHTVVQRCELIASILNEQFGSFRKNVQLKLTYVHATYDTHYYPIGWDIAFFVEAAEITRRLIGAQGTIVNILYPIDIARLPGVPIEYDRAVDLHGREFRIMHICNQISNLFPNVTVNSVKDRAAAVGQANGDIHLINFPSQDRPHHTEYYRIVNANPDLVQGFAASPQAHRYIQSWLSTFATPGKCLICISIRDYPFDPQRNSKLDEWGKFIASLDKQIYEVVIVPDTDQIATYNQSILNQYPAFWPACFDVDLRFALYESAYLNLGVNNGPVTACSLNKKVRYLMFKLVVPGVPHCTEEFIQWSGYPLNGSPGYGTKFQKWVWEDDDFPTIQREFDMMVRQIEQAKRVGGGLWEPADSPTGLHPVPLTPA
jgi:hypothetical protein